MKIHQEIETMGMKARAASHCLAMASTTQKNDFLNNMADLLLERQEMILSANEEDQANAKTLSPSMIDRLKLTSERLKGIADDTRNVAKLPDPVGEEFDAYTNAAGLKIHKTRTPIGVIAVIYESRPNVTIDAASLIVKSGNAAILRGGKETMRTNAALMEVVQTSLEKAGLSKDSAQAILSPDHELVTELLSMDQYIDMLIPRGGAGLHKFCRENSRIPVITGGIGICHLYVDESADLTKCIDVIENAKIQRPTVCNALDTVLVNEKVAQSFIPSLCQRLAGDGVSFRVDPRAEKILRNTKCAADYQLAGDNDFDTEWLSLILGIKIVSGLDEAIDHIQKHSTGHSDGILTENQVNAKKFLANVNSAAVYVNASTRFTDGAQLGLGAEIAISTQPLQARGPMALRELTTYKWVIEGAYTCRG